MNKKSLLHGFDIYGQKIQLTFKGQKSYSTSMGVIVTIIMISAIISYGGYKGAILLNKTDTKVSSA